MALELQRTPGEQLFRLLPDEFIPQLSSNSNSWTNFAPLLSAFNPTADYSNFLRGLVAVHITKLFVLKAKHQVKISENEAADFSSISTFIRSNYLSGISTEEADRLARASLLAAQFSDKDIPNGLKRRLKNSPALCYLCARDLKPDAPEDDQHFFTLEHVWPRSVGGESVEENLLPACTHCQKAKGDTFSWEGFSVQNFAMSPEPSSDAITSIPREVKIARHYLEALQRSDSEKCSLKEAFISIGTYAKPVRFAITGRPITFFDIQTLKA
jgi:hypothetical protein